MWPNSFSSYRINDTPKHEFQKSGEHHQKSHTGTKVVNTVVNRRYFGVVGLKFSEHNFFK